MASRNEGMSIDQESPGTPPPEKKHNLLQRIFWSKKPEGSSKEALTKGKPSMEEIKKTMDKLWITPEQIKNTREMLAKIWISVEKDSSTYDVNLQNALIQFQEKFWSAHPSILDVAVTQDGATTFVENGYVQQASYGILGRGVMSVLREISEAKGGLDELKQELVQTAIGKNTSLAATLSEEEQGKIYETLWVSPSTWFGSRAFVDVVQRFQRDNGLVADGWIGKNGPTWSKLTTLTVEPDPGEPEPYRPKPPSELTVEPTVQPTPTDFPIPSAEPQNPQSAVSARPDEWKESKKQKILDALHAIPWLQDVDVENLEDFWFYLDEENQWQLDDDSLLDWGVSDSQGNETLVLVEGYRAEKGKIIKIEAIPEPANLESSSKVSEDPEVNAIGTKILESLHTNPGLKSLVSWKEIWIDYKSTEGWIFPKGIAWVDENKEGDYSVKIMDGYKAENGKIFPEWIPEEFMLILKKEDKDITNEEIDKILSSEDYRQPWYDRVNPRLTQLRDQRLTRPSLPAIPQLASDIPKPIEGKDSWVAKEVADSWKEIQWSSLNERWIAQPSKRQYVKTEQGVFYKSAQNTGKYWWKIDESHTYYMVKDKKMEQWDVAQIILENQQKCLSAINNVPWFEHATFDDVGLSIDSNGNYELPENSPLVQQGDSIYYHNFWFKLNDKFHIVEGKIFRILDQKEIDMKWNEVGAATPSEPETPKDALRPTDEVAVEKWKGYTILYNKWDWNIDVRKSELVSLCAKYSKELWAIEAAYWKPLTIVLVDTEQNWDKVVENGLKWNLDKDNKYIYPAATSDTYIGAGAWNYYDIGPTLRDHFQQLSLNGSYPGMIFRSYAGAEKFENTFSNEIFEQVAGATFHARLWEKEHDKTPWEEIAPFQVAGLYIDQYFEKLKKKSAKLNSDNLIANINQKLDVSWNFYFDADKNQPKLQGLYQDWQQIPDNVLQIMNEVLQQKIQGYSNNLSDNIQIKFTYDKDTKRIKAEKSKPTSIETPSDTIPLTIPEGHKHKALLETALKSHKDLLKKDWVERVELIPSEWSQETTRRITPGDTFTLKFTFSDWKPERKMPITLSSLIPNISDIIEQAFDPNALADSRTRFVRSLDSQHKTFIISDKFQEFSKKYSYEQKEDFERDIQSILRNVDSYIYSWYPSLNSIGDIQLFDKSKIDKARTAVFAEKAKSDALIQADKEALKKTWLSEWTPQVLLEQLQSVCNNDAYQINGSKIAKIHVYKWDHRSELTRSTIKTSLWETNIQVEKDVTMSQSFRYEITTQNNKKYSIDISHTVWLVFSTKESIETFVSERIKDLQKNLWTARENTP